MTLDEIDAAIKAASSGEITYRDRKVFLAGVEFARKQEVSDEDYARAVAEGTTPKRPPLNP